MDRSKQREIASKGGKAAHQKGTAHEWTSEEARDAGRKGGIASHRRRREQAGGPESEDSRPGGCRIAAVAARQSAAGPGRVAPDPPDGRAPAFPLRLLVRLSLRLLPRSCQGRCRRRAVPCRGVSSRTVTPADYAKARRLLLRGDPVIAALIKRHGACGLAAAQRADHFSALVRAITNQQLSTKAAATIYGRLAALMPAGLRRRGFRR